MCGLFLFKPTPVQTWAMKGRYKMARPANVVKKEPVLVNEDVKSNKPLIEYKDVWREDWQLLNRKVYKNTCVDAEAMFDGENVLIRNVILDAEGNIVSVSAITIIPRVKLKEIEKDVDGKPVKKIVINRSTV